jgi:hypothetical protein
MALQTKTIQATGDNGNHNFTLEVTENSTNAANNTSDISWKFIISPKVVGYDWVYQSNAVYYNVTVNGTATTGHINRYDGESTVTIATGSTTVQHNADGKKQISFSFNISSYGSTLVYLPGYANTSGTMALTTIPRFASLSTVPSSFTDTANPTITYSNPAGSSISTIKACISWTGWDDIVYRDIPKTGTSYTFSFTDAERKKLRQAVTNANGKLTVRFYIWSTIGTEEKRVSSPSTFTLTNFLPEAVSWSAEEAEYTSLTGSSNTVIKGYSNINYQFSVSAKKEATIKSTSITCGSKTATNTYTGSSAATSGSFTNIDGGVVNFKATDSRGNTVERSTVFTVIDYKALTCNIETRGPTTAGTASLQVNGNYWNGNFGARNNTLTVKYRYKQGTASDTSSSYTAWQTATASISGNTYSATVSIPGLDYTKMYTFQAVAYDLIYTSGIESLEKSVKTQPVFDWGEDDFNFNVPVIVQGGSVLTVIEQGTSGIWTYRKWSDGTAECWGSIGVEATFPTSANWGGLFTSGAIAASNVAYPTNLFIEIPVISASLLVRSTGGILMAPGGSSGSAASKTRTGVYEIARGAATSGTQYYTINYDVKGKWK